jgi:hypothetical protein
VYELTSTSLAMSVSIAARRPDSQAVAWSACDVMREA